MIDKQETKDRLDRLIIDAKVLSNKIERFLEDMGYNGDDDIEDGFFDCLEEASIKAYDTLSYLTEAITEINK